MPREKYDNFVSLQKNKNIMSKHLIHNENPLPYSCEQCLHFIENVKCKAFEIIPIDYICDAEAHNKVVKGQKGDFVFQTNEKRQYMRVYTIG